MPNASGSLNRKCSCGQSSMRFVVKALLQDSNESPHYVFIHCLTGFSEICHPTFGRWGTALLVTASDWFWTEAIVNSVLYGRVFPSKRLDLQVSNKCVVIRYENILKQIWPKIISFVSYENQYRQIHIHFAPAMSKRWQKCWREITPLVIIIDSLRRMVVHCRPSPSTIDAGFTSILRQSNTQIDKFNPSKLLNQKLLANIIPSGISVSVRDRAAIRNERPTSKQNV